MQQSTSQFIDFTNQLEKHEEYKNLVKKISMLKDGLRKERIKTQHTRLQILRKEKAFKQIQREIMWKQDAHQTIHSQDRQIVNQILVVRAKKRKLLQQLRSLQSDSQSGHERSKSVETSQN